MFKYRFKLPQIDGAGSKTVNDWIKSITMAVEKCLNITGGGIATVKTSPNGMAIYVPPFPVQIAITTSAITARSGSTAGSGTASFQMFNPPTFTADPSRTNQTIYNMSSATGGVATGKYVALIKWYNEWFIIAAEC